MKLLAPVIGLSSQVLGQVPDGGWIRDPMNIDTNLKTCGFFDIDDGMNDSTRVLDSDRIINGVTAEVGTWPWIVSFAENGNRICGGTIIHDRWILSAEHCFPHIRLPYGEFIKDLDPKDWLSKHTQFWFGDHDKRQDSDVDFKLFAERLVFRKERATWAGYIDKQTVDIVLVRVPSITQHIANNNLAAAEYVRPACLPTAHVPHGQRCWIAGWGFRKFGKSVWGQYYGSDLARYLQEASVNVFSNEYCLANSQINTLAESVSEIQKGSISTWMEFCAGIPDLDGDGKIDGGIDACAGDSGGPLVCDVNGEATLIGITSRGTGCALEDHPGIYTTVADYADWAKEMIKLYTRDDDEDPIEEEPTTEPATTLPTETEASEAPITLKDLEDRAFDAWEEPNCFKPNGDAHDNKTKGQKKARVKKVQAYIKTMKKYLGPDKREMSCGTDKTVTLSQFEFSNGQNAMESFSDISEKIINAGYSNCKAAKNWIKGTNNKIKAIDNWRKQASNKGC